MKTLSITINRLEESHNGRVFGSEVNVKVFQQDRLLVEDKFTGLVTGPFTRTFSGVAGDGDLRIEHDRPELAELTVSAEVS
ncbi:hypothetical protein JOE25_005334 [Serratia sp. PL17]|uniref:hypothetical protein n=1 Tax=Serratia sp. PL17 TaxID=2806582 RepID=UPI001AE49967|nr:hypothetical protein [Serratia sp. PL17]MBP1133710.1 hypothetical protein [Serratia sp. PL17]